MPACPLFHAGAHRHAVLVLFLRGKSAADVAFGFVDVQNDARLGGKGRIDLFEAFRDVLMYRRFADPEPFRRLPHRCVMLNNITGDRRRALFNIILQRNCSPILFYSV